MKKKLLAFFLSAAWIGFSEFVRNELLFKSHWINKYNSLNLVFPSEMINNAVWGIWSFLLAGLIVFLSTKLRLIENIVVSWLFAFVLMWLVAGNLNVLPLSLLLFAIPLSIIEITLACFIASKMKN